LDLVNAMIVADINYIYSLYKAY